MRLVSFTHLSTLAPAGLVVLSLVALGAPRAETAATPQAPKAGAEEPSLDVFFAALAAAPDDASAARARGRIEARWKASGSATADLLSSRALTAVHAGDRALALDLLDAVIVVAPSWANARLYRALIRIAGDDTGRAAVDLAETLRLEPRHFGAMAALSRLAEDSGRKADALKWLRRLATIDPRTPGLDGRIERLSIEVEGREL